MTAWRIFFSMRCEKMHFDSDDLSVGSHVVRNQKEDNTCDEDEAEEGEDDGEGSQADEDASSQAIGCR